MITKEVGTDLKGLIAFRKTLVYDYAQINHSELQKAVAANLKNLTVFTISVREYLVHELGPVSAFKN